MIRAEPNQSTTIPRLAGEPLCTGPRPTLNKAERARLAGTCEIALERIKPTSLRTVFNRQSRAPL